MHMLRRWRGRSQSVNGAPLSLFQRLGIFISGAGMNQGSWPCPPRAWQRMERQPQKVRVSSFFLIYFIEV